jgi:hypothetical protein
MYCIECGAQIPDNSKFCSNCGHNQTVVNSLIKERVEEVVIDKEITQVVDNIDKSFLNFMFLKKSMAFYLAWVLIHLGLLLIASDGIFAGRNMGADSFWPIGSHSSYGINVEIYDITEFLVYTIFPLLGFIIWKLIRNKVIEV